jgi:hypothetical protein
MAEIAASRCPRCQAVVAPPATYCPWHPVAMTPTTVPGVGEIVSFTTLHSAPEGFRSPLHIAIVELEGGARFVCHGDETRGLRIGSSVAIEAIDDVYYFSHLGALERARLPATVLAPRRPRRRPRQRHRAQPGQAGVEQGDTCQLTSR